MADSKSPIVKPDPTPQPDENLDGAMDADIDMDINPEAPVEEPQADQDEAAPETPAPTKKDISLRDFLSKMDDYAPIVRLLSPRSLPHNYLGSGGLLENNSQLTTYHRSPTQ